MERLDTKALYIIGNGFDLLHGVNSSFYDFRDFMRQVNKTMNNGLGTYFDCGNFWGEFEDKLASISPENLMQLVDNILDIYMDIFQEDPNDFSYDNYATAIDIGVRVVDDLTVQLPRQFKDWVKSLEVRKETLKSLENLIKEDAIYINFNYTEFLETIYNIEHDNILYIHGDRRKDDELVLGHGRDPGEVYGYSYDKKYSNNLTSIEELGARGNTKIVNPIRHFAADYVANRIRDYFYANANRTLDIIDNN